VLEEARMAARLDETLKWVHRANIERYRRILQTPLSNEERSFVRRRIGEEQQAMTELDGGRRSPEPAVRIDRVG